MQEHVRTRASRHLRPELQRLERHELLTGPAPFAALGQPVGLATNAGGHVFVSGLDQQPHGTSTVVEEFSPQGSLMGRQVIISGLAVSPGSLTAVSVSAALGPNIKPGDVLDLLPDGEIWVDHPNGGSIKPWLNLVQLGNVDRSSVFDIATGHVADFSGRITMQAAFYGQIAVWHDALYVTALAQGTTFVMRVPIGGNGSAGAPKVVLGSSVPSMNQTLVPGVAINASGQGLTTLPVHAAVPGQSWQVPVSFRPGFDLGSVQTPFVASPAKLCSLGITTDSAGRFFVSPGSGGSALLGTTSGIVEVNATLTKFTPIAVVPGASRAVAAAPDGSLYLSYLDTGQVWRVPADPWRPVAGDYTGSGRASLALVRPPTGQWLVWGLGTLPIGQPGDRPVPADYLGNGLTQPAVFRPSTDQWIIPGRPVQKFGMPGDFPVPGDYDGDGRADVAVYRPSTGQWLILGTSTGSRIVAFGQPGKDIPVPADYDGDGKTDLAVYRPSTGQWLIMGSKAGPETIAFGVPGLDIPVPANYGNVGHAQPAVYRPGTGQWLIQGANPLPFGLPNVDLPVPGDYLGLGYDQVAMYRPTTGQWLFFGAGTISFGWAHIDVPVNLPTAYAFADFIKGQSVRSIRAV